MFAIILHRMFFFCKKIILSNHILFCKITKNKCKHFIGTTNGISKDSYGGMNELLGETGQGNVFSGNVCRDVSCFIFKEIEKKRLGMMLTSKHDDVEVQINVIAFVNDSDFCSNGVEYELKMQKIVNDYAKTHEATGGKVKK